MTKEEKLKKIIEYAGKEAITSLGYLAVTVNKDFSVILKSKAYYSIIFDHSFLKAFFSSGKPHPDNPHIDVDICCVSRIGRSCPYHGERWQYHAQQLVLAEDRIQYLFDFINK